MIKKKVKFLLSLLIIYPLTCLAAITTDPRQRLDSGAGQAGYDVMSKPSLQSVLIVIIKYALGLIGMIFVALILYAGYQWMTSAGNEDKITKAKSNLLNAVIGLIIIFLAYSITWFVADVLIKATVPGYYSFF